MRVVEDEHHRGALHREVGEHPVEAVAQALLVGGAPSDGAHRPSAGPTIVYQLPSWARSSASAIPASWGCRSWRATWKATPCSWSPPRADRTVQPWAAARRRTSARKRRAPAHSGASGEGEERAAGPLGCFGSVLAQTGELVQRLVGGGEFTLPFEECPSAAYSALSHDPPPGHGGAVHAGSGCVP